MQATQKAGGLFADIGANAAEHYSKDEPEMQQVASSAEFSIFNSY